MLPTYEEDPPDANAPFDLFTTSRFNYPYTIRDRLTSRRVLRRWRTLNLENEYLRCSVLPDLGGHLYTCTDKVNGQDLFYANTAIKLANVAYRGAWAALGIEFNFPVSHNWMTVSPVDYRIVANADRSASIWVGNIDRVYGGQWRVALTLRPREAVLEQRTYLYNASPRRHRFYWWTNAAVRVTDESRILYPMRHTASHGFTEVDTWPVDKNGIDLSIVGNHKYGPVSLFSHGSREGFMAVYHPPTRSGVAHYSPPDELPAKKFWSWSSDADGLDWRKALSDDDSAYVEVQAGLFRNQETYAFLEPQETIGFSEYWLPLRDLGGLVRATRDAALNLTRTAEARRSDHTRGGIYRDPADGAWPAACARRQPDPRRRGALGRPRDGRSTEIPGLARACPLHLRAAGCGWNARPAHRGQLRLHAFDGHPARSAAVAAAAATSAGQRSGDRRDRYARRARRPPARGVPP